MGLPGVEATPQTAPAIDVADRNSRNASLTLAFAQPGDTLLYLLLPLNHDGFGVSLAEAGLLLAANRLVRIAGYGWVARFYADRGPHAACLLAALGSLMSSLGYATLSGVWALLIARLMWGLSFAAMNIATQVLATAEPAGAARRSGRMRAIVAAGPVSGLIVGAVVSHLTGPREAFLVLSAAALLAFLFAAQLPRLGEGRPERLQRPRFGVPSRLDTWSFIQGMTLDGLFVLGISILAAAAIRIRHACSRRSACVAVCRGNHARAERWRFGTALRSPAGAHAAVGFHRGRACGDRGRGAVDRRNPGGRT
jgi:MFS family permease